MDRFWHHRVVVAAVRIVAPSRDSTGSENAHVPHGTVLKKGTHAAGGVLPPPKVFSRVCSSKSVTYRYMEYKSN